MDMDDAIRQVGESVTETTVEKHMAYGHAIETVRDLMLILYPNGIRPEQYHDVLIMVRDLDKCCRIAKGDKTAFGESPWRDRAGYAILGAAQDLIEGDNNNDPIGRSGQIKVDMDSDRIVPRRERPNVYRGPCTSVHGPLKDSGDQDGEDEPWLGSRKVL